MKLTFDISQDEVAKAMLARRKARAGALQTAKALEEPQEPKDNAPIRHALQETIYNLLNLRCNVWLVGPAGSGKSKCAELAALDLGLPYFCPPIGRETPISQLFGYFNASGNYVRTPLRQAVENGGVCHLEEIDFASPAVGTAINSVLANDYIGFPDQTIKRHGDFILIASANTYGNGANAQYIGSQGINAATRDRFVYVDFPYDEKMESQIAPNKAWTAHVQSVRKAVNSLALRHVVSPRASINGGKMINSKAFTWEQVEHATIYAGLDQITVQKIKAIVEGIQTI